MVKKVSFLLFLMINFVSYGQVRLPQLISDGLILQREAPVKIWGWASPNENVTVNFNPKLSTINSQFSTKADEGGNWEIQLPPQKAGGPYTIKINTIEIKNILFGDVWLCSGQSNMETPVSRVMSLFGEEISGYSNPKIRYVKIPLTYNFHGPQIDVPPCSWVDVTPESAQDFSAVAYFFAKEMFEKTGIPVGIINSSVGGSPAEAWISEESLKVFPAMLNDMRICQSDEFVADMLKYGSIPGHRWNTILSEQDKGLTEAIQWLSPDYEDSNWSNIDLLVNSWGQKNSRPVNGSFWFRKEIEVPAELAGQEAMLYMGRLIDADFTYINGQLVGSTSYQYPPRNYTVPQGLIKAGKNTIVVRLISQSGFPGFVSEKPYKLVFKNKETFSLEGEWKYKQGAPMPAISGGGITFQYKPTGLYNAMITPLKNHAFKGVLWYQGEANTERYTDYYDLMSLLIGDWRKLWRDNLPFFSVQLANYMEPSLLQQNSGWAELRNVQRKLSQTIPNTGMAVAIDIGEWNDIHPLNKKDVGKRLALQARKIVYGEKIVSDGPVYQSHIIEGNKIIISFKEGTNNFKPVDEIKGFAIAGTDGIYKLAHAVIDGKCIVVWNDEITQPQKVRYAWANNPEGANLYNQEGLPASPFQTESAPLFKQFSYTGNDPVYNENPLKSDEFYSPILQGCYPDPSITRKGNDFYLVTSSFVMVPGVPIFHSTDLVNWRQIGHVLDRPSQLKVQDARISAGIYAPMITYNPYNDTFYMITTHIAAGMGNIVVKTKDPLKGWSDPFKLQFDGIDPSLFFDKNGKAYVVHNDAPDEGKELYSGHRVIKIWEYDTVKDKVIAGTDKIIVDGGVDITQKPIWIEAPHLYKKNGRYYLMCAEGGTGDWHSEVIFVSDNPKGPYIPAKNNPILTQRYLPKERKNKVDWAGHADLIECPNGKYYGVFLAIRPNEKDRVNTGRETFILPVDWSGEFPVFENGLDPILPKLKMPQGVINQTGKDRFFPNGNFTFTDNFNSDKLDYRWIGVRGWREDFTNLTKNGLKINPFPVSIKKMKPTSTLFYRQQHNHFEASVVMDYKPASIYELAGIVCYQSEEFNYVFGITRKNNDYYILLEKNEPEGRQRGAPIISTIVASEIIDLSKPVKLQVKARGDDYQFSYSVGDDVYFKNLGGIVSGDILSTNVAGGFTGSLVGLYATSANDIVP